MSGPHAQEKTQRCQRGSGLLSKNSYGIVMRASPSFKAAEEAEAARVRAKQRGARVLWLPSGCVVGDTVWVLEYAQELDAAGSG